MDEPCTRPWTERPHETLKNGGGACPIEPTVVRRDFDGIRRAFVGLRRRLDLTLGQAGQRFDDQPRAELRQKVVKRLCRGSGIDRDRPR